MRLTLISLLMIPLAVGCGDSEKLEEDERIEGSEGGDCSDGADNDLDGIFDCDEAECAGSPDCEETDTDDDTDADDTGTDADDTGAAPAEPPAILETTRGPISPDNLEFGTFPGLVGVPNLDDDDENGEADWSQLGLADGENDYSLANLITNGNAIELDLNGAGIRIYSDDGLILSDDTDTTFTVPSDAETLALRVEFSDFLTQGTLVVQDLSHGRDFEVALTASPLLFNHHLQAAEETMVMSTPGNEDLVSTMMDTLGDLTIVPDEAYEWDVWVQDEFEFGYATSPDAHLDIIFDTIRDRGLDDFPEDYYQQPDWVILNFGGDPTSASTLDSAGNLEVSPPVTVDDIEYPYGRIYMGGVPGGLGPAMATQDALDSFQIQKPFMIDSTWLLVGHVREIFTTIPDPLAPKGFRVLMSDTRLAWEIMEAAPASTALPKYEEFGYFTIGSITDSTPLRDFNTEAQAKLDEAEDTLRSELGLDDEDIIYVPALFHLSYGYKAPLLPSMTNLLVSNDELGNSFLFIADPFMRTDEADPSSDPIVAYLLDQLPEETLDVVFVDDWQTYHLQLGTVGSGTNVKRTAPRTWWNDGAHLFADEE